MSSTINVAEVLNKHHIFLTGGSGFVGMGLLHKLLSCCGLAPSFLSTKVNGDSNSNVEFKIYCLLRKSNQYQSINDRLKDEIFKNPLFSEYSSEEIEYLMKQKVIAIEGCLTSPLLGVNEKQYNQMLHSSKEGIYFVHCAADVSFDRPVNDAMNVNVNGTYQCLELAKKLNTKGFVHVSTLYVNSREGVEERVYEKIYDEGFDRLKLFDEWLANNQYLNDKDIFNIANQTDPNNTQQKKQWPNTYTLTKNIAEQVAMDYCSKNNIQLSIARLGLLAPISSGKHQGWFAGSGAVVLFIIGASLGHLRYVKGNGQGRADIVPIDYTVNAMLGISAELLQNNGNTQPRIYNVGVVAEFSEDWTVANMLSQVIPRFVAEKLSGVAKPHVSFITNPLLFFLIEFILYDIPLNLMNLLQRVLLLQHLFTLDFWIRLLIFASNYFKGTSNEILKDKPKNEIEMIEDQLKNKPSKWSKKLKFLMKARSKASEFSSTYTNFVDKRWRFDHSNVKELYSKLDEKSQEVFKFDVNSMNFATHVSYILETSVCVMKEWNEKQQKRHQEEKKKDMSLQKRLQELKQAKAIATELNERKVWSNIKRIGENVGGIGLSHFFLSFAASLILLWIFFSF